MSKPYLTKTNCLVTINDDTNYQNCIIIDAIRYKNLKIEEWEVVDYWLTDLAESDGKRYEPGEDGCYEWIRMKITDNPDSPIYHNDNKIYKNGDYIASTDNLIKEEVESLIKLYDVDTDYSPLRFFSICNLNECVCKLQKEFILKHIDRCGAVENCPDLNKYDKMYRDFLFVTSYILDFYIQEDEFELAEDILKQISTCSNLYCGSNNHTKNCGCNG